MAEQALTRREVIQAAAGAGALAALSTVPAGAAVPACGRLEDIEHVVILVQENRSFDNYFGSYRGVRGFADPRAPRLGDGSGLSVFAQPIPSGDTIQGTPGAAYGGHLYPFHLQTRDGGSGECTNDVNHSWGPQHRSYDAGRLDAFLAEHLKPSVNGPANGPGVMGYYRREDLAFYYALADAFTICDQYFCSVIGPTDPNRLYTVAASIDPSGRRGGPIVSTAPAGGRHGQLSYTTMPEQLQARGVSWKVYAGPDGNLGDNVLAYFKQYVDGRHPELTANAFTPTFPGTFEADAAADTLPQVSWVLAPLVQSEHPPAPVAFGEDATATVLRALMENPRVWAKSALLVTWDENGGAFDHVAPPTPPPGTAGEYLTADPLPSGAEGIRGPIGLGFRVPLLIASPFSRGGLVSSDTFDHTSLLRFLETRFGAEVPNLTDWRRSAVGDLTSALNFAGPDASVPRLPDPMQDPAPITDTNCPLNAGTGEIDEGLPIVPTYPVPPPSRNHLSGQELGRARRPSGTVSCRPSGTGRRAAGGSPHGTTGTHARGGARAGASAAFPRGGVEAGAGGTARPSVTLWPLGVGAGGLLAALGAALLGRRARVQRATSERAGGDL